MIFKSYKVYADKELQILCAEMRNHAIENTITDYKEFIDEVLKNESVEKCGDFIRISGDEVPEILDGYTKFVGLEYGKSLYAVQLCFMRFMQEGLEVRQVNIIENQRQKLPESLVFYLADIFFESQSFRTSYTDGHAYVLIKGGYAGPAHEWN